MFSSVFNWVGGARAGLASWFGGVVKDAGAKIDVEGGHGEDKGELIRHMGLLTLVFFTITQAVGAGILTTPGLISAKAAGSWAFMSYLWAGLIVAPAVLNLAYNAMRSSRAGSTGSYASKYFGQLVGLLMFMDVMLECVGGTAAVAVSQGEHVKLIFDIWAKSSGEVIVPGFHWMSLVWMGLIGFVAVKVMAYGTKLRQVWKTQRAEGIGLTGRLCSASQRLAVLAVGAVLLFWSGCYGADFLRHLPDYLTTSPKNVLWDALGIFVVGGAFGVGLTYYGIKARWNRKLALPNRILNLSLRLGGLVVGLGLVMWALVSGIQFACHLESVNLLSVLVIAAITVVLLRGIKETAWITNAFTVLKLVVLAVIILMLRRHFDWANINRPIPEDLPGTLAGASTAFFAYVGLDMATTSAGETKNPTRNVPLGMMIGAVVVMLLYVTAALVLNGAVPYEKLQGSSAPFSKALVELGYTQAATWVAIASTLAMVSVVLASAYSTTRLLYNVAEHDMLPWFNKVNSKGVPVIATLTVGAFIGVLTALLDVDELMHLTNIGTMTAFITVSAIVFVKELRETKWGSKDALRGGLWVLSGVLGMVGPGILVYQLACIAPSALIRLLLVWGAVILLFVFYTRHRTRARVAATAAAEAAKDVTHEDEQKGE